MLAVEQLVREVLPKGDSEFTVFRHHAAIWTTGVDICDVSGCYRCVGSLLLANSLLTRVGVGRYRGSLEWVGLVK